MKNIFLHFNSAALLVCGLFILAALWVFVQTGFDGVLLALLLVACCVTFLLNDKALGSDPRMGSLQKLITDVADGKVSGRIVNIGKKDQLGALCWHVNNMLDQLESCFREQQTVLKMASTGKYFRKAQPLGLHGVFYDALNRTNHSLTVMESAAQKEQEQQRVTQEAQQEVACLVSSTARGDFSLRLTEEGKEGFFLMLARDLNALSATTETALQEAEKVLRALAQGDLTESVTGQYEGIFGELKTHCNQTSGNLSGMIREIRDAVEAINLAASEIAAGNSDLSSRTEQQAASLEETASSMEELTGTVRQNAANARQVTELASQATDVAVNGGRLIEKVVEKMDAINQSAQRIEDVVNVIDTIAFQTNILALNAAVEAARVGDQGRGFAVVASEVRSLAQRSANAAKDVKSLISSSVTQITQGNELVGQSGNIMKEIVTAIKRVDDFMADIAAASAEQATGIDEIGKAVVQMDDMTQQNAALVEQAAAAAQSLQTQADQLAGRVSGFNLSKGNLQAPRIGV
jgi:methyl-accepting chemotaxis protein